MGIHGLTKFLIDKAPSAVQQRPANIFMSNTVAIDASTSLYAFMIAIRDSENYSNLTNSAGDSTSHLAGMLTRAIRILELGMKPIYVFDGQAPQLKSGELAKRRDRKAAAEAEMVEARERGDEERVRVLAGRTVRVTKKENEDVKKLLRLMGIPILDAPGEAECQCAYLCRAGVADAVVSEDADSLCFGAKILVKGLNFQGSASSNSSSTLVTTITLSKVLDELQLSQEEFIEFCILCGCDYCEAMKGVGPHTAYKWIQKYRSIANLFKANSIEPDKLERIASSTTVDQLSQAKVEEPIREVKTEEEVGEGNESENEDEKSGGVDGETMATTSKTRCVCLERKNVQIPSCFPYDDALQLFLHPNVIPVDELTQMDFSQLELQEQELVDFLVRDNQFNEQRVANAIVRLKAARRLSSQTRIDAFFTTSAKQPQEQTANKKRLSTAKVAAAGKRRKN